MTSKAASETESTEGAFEDITSWNDAEEGLEADLDDIKGEDFTMPTATPANGRKSGRVKTPPRAAATGNDDNDLAKGMGKMKIAKSYSFDVKSASMVKSFIKNKKYIAEVEFIMAPEVLCGRLDK